MVGGVALVALIPAGAATATTAAAAPQVSAPHVVVHSPLAAGLRHERTNGTVESTNWGGYAAQDSAKFTEVQGTWVQPTSTCSSRTDQYAAFWVGIDGYSSDSVEQIGTDSDCDGVNKPNYYAWYEMYPSASVELSPSSYPVKPGQTITGKVSVSGSNFTLTITNGSWTFSTTQSGSGLAQSSAEWIAESPEICSRTCTLAQLADFGTVGFTNSDAEVTGQSSPQPISSFTYDGGPQEIICETSNGTVRDEPSALGSGGNNFTITWKHD